MRKKHVAAALARPLVVAGAGSPAVAQEPASAAATVSLVAYAQRATTSSSLSLSRPSGVRSGDLLVLLTQGGDGQLPDTQSGWTRFARCFEADNGDSSCRTSGGDLGIVAYRQTAGSNEPSTYTLSRGRSGHIIAALVVLRDARNSDPIYSYTYLPNDGKSSESHCPSTAGVSGGYHVASRGLSASGATPRIRSTNDGSTSGGNNDLLLAFVVSPG